MLKIITEMSGKFSQVSADGLRRPKWILFSETRPDPEGKETEEIPKETDQIQTMDDYIMAYCPDGFED